MLAGPEPRTEVIEIKPVTRWGINCLYEMAENGTKWHGFGVFSGIFGRFDVRLISEGIVFSGLRFEALGGPWQKGCQNVL